MASICRVHRAVPPRRSLCEQPAIRPAAMLAPLSCSQPTQPAALRDAAPSSQSVLLPPAMDLNSCPKVHPIKNASPSPPRAVASWPGLSTANLTPRSPRRIDSRLTASLTSLLIGPKSSHVSLQGHARSRWLRSPTTTAERPVYPVENPPRRRLVSYHGRSVAAISRVAAVVTVSAWLTAGIGECRTVTLEKNGERNPQNVCSVETVSSP